MGQPMSSAHSIFPKPLEKFEGAFWDAVVEQLQGYRETHHFCKSLSPGEPQTLTLCNGWVTVEPLRGCGVIPSM